MSENRILGTIRGAFIAVFVPVHFSITSGHLRSALAGKPVDYAGRPVPWYSLPAVQFLAQIDFGDSDVLEFGAGNSTLWWADRARSVLSLESHRGWHETLTGELEGRLNVECVLVEDAAEYVAYPRGRQFDVVVVDGDDRVGCASTALEVVREDGVIIIDDSEGHWGRPPTFPIIDLLQGAGFSRVDFFGYPGGVRRPHATSLFFRGGAPLFSGLAPPMRPYVV